MICKNDAQLTIGGLILIVSVLIVIVAMMLFLLSPPSCDESEQVQLVGILYGFEKNNTGWDVRLDNVTYYFNHWDKSYMEKMLGYNVTIIACDRRVHFDFLTAFINPED